MFVGNSGFHMQLPEPVCKRKVNFWFYFRVIYGHAGVIFPTLDSHGLGRVVGGRQSIKPP